MQPLLRALLAIYLAHLLTDFVFQTHRLVEQKRRGSAAAYLLHGLIHYLSAVIITGFVLRGSILSLRAHLVIAALTLVHLLIDLAKIQLAKKYPVCDGSWAYVSDQLLQFLTVSLAAWLLPPPRQLSQLNPSIHNFRAITNKCLAGPMTYVG